MADGTSETLDSIGDGSDGSLIEITMKDWATKPQLWWVAIAAAAVTGVFALRQTQLNARLERELQDERLSHEILLQAARSTQDTELEALRASQLQTVEAIRLQNDLSREILRATLEVGEAEHHANMERTDLVVVLSHNLPLSFPLDMASLDSEPFTAAFNGHQFFVRVENTGVVAAESVSIRIEPGIRLDRRVMVTSSHDYSPRFEGDNFLVVELERVYPGEATTVYFSIDPEIVFGSAIMPAHEQAYSAFCLNCRLLESNIRVFAQAIGVGRPDPVDGTAGHLPAPTTLPRQLPLPKAMRSYNVLPGDTMFSIARRFSVTPTTILYLNPGLQTRLLTVGERIWIP